MKKIWKFKLDSDYSIDLSKYLGEINDCVFIDYKEDQIEIVGFIANGILTIIKGYEWDGCTPKVSVFKFLLGVPDFKGTYRSSLVHDFLIEYCIQHTLSRKQVDAVFQKIMKDEKFLLEFLYSGGVCLFRPLALKIGPCK